MFWAILKLLLVGAYSLPPFVDQTSLFDPKLDGIIPLYDGNIKQFLNYSTLPVIVLYYASWCGHCIGFSNPYKKLQKEMENWGVYLAAINCANHRNNQACDAYYSIYAYPTIYIYDCLENEKDKKRVNMRNLTSKLVINDMRKAIASYLVKQTKCKPVVHSLSSLDLKFWEDFKSRSTPYDRLIIIIDEKLDTGLLDSISLDLRICNRILVTFIDINQKDMVSLFGTYNTSTIISVDSSMNIQTITSAFADYELLRARLFETVKDICPEISILTHLLFRPQGSPKFYNMKLPKSVGVHLEDIIGGVGMSLRHEIPRQPIADDMVPIIKRYVDIVGECIYWPKEQKEFLHSLKEWLDSQGNTVKTDEWNAFMNSDQATSVFPIEAKWITCKGQNEYFRGFPCSLWLTFHIATVKCENINPNTPYTSLDVLLAMRGYITNFFGCQDCREHFREVTKHVEKQVNSGDQGILFLWNTHNMVNARLRKADSADPTAPKIQFPSEEMCPDCRANQDTPQTDMFNSTPGYEISPISWDRKNVLNFMRSHYGPSNIRLPEKNVTVASEDLYDASDEFAESVVPERMRKHTIIYT